MSDQPPCDGCALPAIAVVDIGDGKRVIVCRSCAVELCDELISKIREHDVNDGIDFNPCSHSRRANTLTSSRCLDCGAMLRG